MIYEDRGLVVRSIEVFRSCLMTRSVVCLTESAHAPVCIGDGHVFRFNGSLRDMSDLSIAPIIVLEHPTCTRPPSKPSTLLDRLQNVRISFIIGQHGVAAYGEGRLLGVDVGPNLSCHSINQMCPSVVAAKLTYFSPAICCERRPFNGTYVLVIGVYRGRTVPQKRILTPAGQHLCV